jgi:hypothetical protein
MMVLVLARDHYLREEKWNKQNGSRSSGNAIMALTLFANKTLLIKLSDNANSPGGQTSV